MIVMARQKSKRNLRGVKSRKWYDHWLVKAAVASLVTTGVAWLVSVVVQFKVAATQADLNVLGKQISLDMKTEIDRHHRDLVKFVEDGARAAKELADASYVKR